MNETILESDESYQYYIRNIVDYKYLSLKREKELADIIQKSNDNKEIQKAKDELTVSNLKLVIKLALHYYFNVCKVNKLNTCVMDLIQAGNIGLMKAVTKYQSKHNCKLGTYAGHWIEKEIKKAINDCRMIKIPLHHYGYFSKISKLKSVYGKDLTDEIIMRELKITTEVLNILQEENRTRPIELKDFDLFIGSFNNNGNKIMLDIDRNDLLEYIHSKLKKLPINYYEVFHMRYFEGFAVKLIGPKINKTRQRVEQILRNGIKILKQKIHEDKIRKEIK